MLKLSSEAELITRYLPDSRGTKIGNARLPKVQFKVIYKDEFDSGFVSTSGLAWQAFDAWREGT